MEPFVVRRPRLAEDIAFGSQLAQMQNRPISPEQIARVMRDAGLKFVIVGAHAANGYTGQPRATGDVDVIAQFPKKTVEVIIAAFPQLQPEDTPVVIRLKDDDRVAVDVMKPGGLPLWPALLNEAKDVEVDGALLRIPTLEGVLAAKFAAMVSPLRRQADRMIDGGDFLRIIDANPTIDLPTLERLGELVYAGGGKKIVSFVADARAGKPLRL